MQASVFSSQATHWDPEIMYIQLSHIMILIYTLLKIDFWSFFPNWRGFSQLPYCNGKVSCNICAKFNYSQSIAICVCANTDIQLWQLHSFLRAPLTIIPRQESHHFSTFILLIQTSCAFLLEPSSSTGSLFLWCSLLPFSVLLPILVIFSWIWLTRTLLFPRWVWIGTLYNGTNTFFSWKCFAWSILGLDLPSSQMHHIISGIWFHWKEQLN